MLVLGDSFAEGLGVDVDARFSSLLADRLRALWPARRVRVINAGQIGTAPADYLDNLAAFGVALRPAVVVITVYAGNESSECAVGALAQPCTRPFRRLRPRHLGSSVLGGPGPSSPRSYGGPAAARAGLGAVFGGPIDEGRYRRCSARSV